MGHTLTAARHRSARVYLILILTDDLLADRGFLSAAGYLRGSAQELLQQLPLLCRIQSFPEAGSVY